MKTSDKVDEIHALERRCQVLEQQRNRALADAEWGRFIFDVTNTNQARVSCRGVHVLDDTDPVYPGVVSARVFSVEIGDDEAAPEREEP